MDLTHFGLTFYSLFQWRDMPDKDSWSLPLDIYEHELSDLTVLRLSRKIFAGEETLDLRLWRRDKGGKLYPSRKGLCMRTAFWSEAFKLFNDHALLISTNKNT